MDELQMGRRDKRNHWWPRVYAEVAPVFVLPPRPRAFLRWLPSYVLPWNLLFFGTSEEKGMQTHAYTHYLHHKYFEVNYGEGLVPIDHWMGTWHDGSPEADARMEARHAAKIARMNAGQ